MCSAPFARGKESTQSPTAWPWIFSERKPNRRPTQGCVFVGALDYYPNVDAAEWFCREVWPTIHQRHPTATFSSCRQTSCRGGAAPGQAARRPGRGPGAGCPAVPVQGRRGGRAPANCPRSAEQGARGLGHGQSPWSLRRRPSPPCELSPVSTSWPLLLLRNGSRPSSSCWKMQPCAGKTGGGGSEVRQGPPRLGALPGASGRSGGFAWCRRVGKHRLTPFSTVNAQADRREVQPLRALGVGRQGDRR